MREMLNSLERLGEDNPSPERELKATATVTAIIKAIRGNAEEVANWQEYKSLEMLLGANAAKPETTATLIKTLEWKDHKVREIINKDWTETRATKIQRELIQHPKGRINLLLAAELLKQPTVNETEKLAVWTLYPGLKKQRMEILEETIHRNGRLSVELLAHMQITPKELTTTRPGSVNILKSLQTAGNLDQISSLLIRFPKPMAARFTGMLKKNPGLAAMPRITHQTQWNPQEIQHTFQIEVLRQWATWFGEKPKQAPITTLVKYGITADAVQQALHLDPKTGWPKIEGFERTTNLIWNKKGALALKTGPDEAILPTSRVNFGNERETWGQLERALRNEGFKVTRLITVDMSQQLTRMPTTAEDEKRTIARLLQTALCLDYQPQYGWNNIIKAWNACKDEYLKDAIRKTTIDLATHWESAVQCSDPNQLDVDGWHTVQTEILKNEYTLKPETISKLL